MRTIKRLLLAVLLILVSTHACAQDLAVAASADLSAVFPEVAARFEKETGKKVRLNFGSSGQFVSQIEKGAPFDLFFSADLLYALRLESEGLLEPGSVYRYAVGKLVLYVPKGLPVNPSQGLRALLSPAVRKIAIANPEHEPYGRAAVEALRREGIYDQVDDKLITSEDIAQAAQLVQSGKADVGILALSLARSPGMRSAGRFAELPVTDYAPLVEAAGILKNSANKGIATSFLIHLRSPQIAQLLAHYGFALPVASGKAR
jgi:molybdate transport system substrate-binding protein